MVGFPYDDITIGPARLTNRPCLKGLSRDPHFSMLRSLTVRVVSATPNLFEIYSIKIDCATSFPVNMRMLRRGIAVGITLQIYPEARDRAGHFVTRNMGCMMKTRRAQAYPSLP
jgi:hypothetical protein